MLIPSKKQWKSWKYVTKVGIIGSFASIISLIVAVIIIVWPSQHSSIPIPPDKFDIIKVNNYAGYGGSFVLKIEKLDRAKRKFILDIGNDTEINRVSLYLDSKNNLVYRLIDEEGESHLIKIPNSFKTFLLNTWYHIYFDYGYSEDFAFMRLYINNKMMGDSYFHYKINIPKDLDLNNNEMVILNDLTKSYPAKATVSLLSIQNQTFTEEEIRKLMNVSLYYLENVDAFDQQ